MNENLQSPVTAQLAPCLAEPSPDLKNLVPDPDVFDTEGIEDQACADRRRKQCHLVRRRAEGATYAVIAAELGVPPSTLAYWSREYRQDIQNIRAMRMDVLQNQALSSPEMRVQRMARLLSEIETELGNRKITELPTSRLFSMADTLRRRIAQETGTLKFTDAADEESDDKDFVWKG